MTVSYTHLDVYKRQEYKYIEIPLNYVWEDFRKKWKRRRRGGDKIITHIYVVSPKAVSYTHLI